MHAGNFRSHYFAALAHPEDRIWIWGYQSAGWYFYDESEANVIGPYPTFEVAEKARSEYKP